MSLLAIATDLQAVLLAKIDLPRPRLLAGLVRSQVDHGDHHPRIQAADTQGVAISQTPDLLDRCTGKEHRISRLGQHPHLVAAAEALDHGMVTRNDPRGQDNVVIAGAPQADTLTLQGVGLRVFTRYGDQKLRRAAVFGSVGVLPHHRGHRGLFRGDHAGFT